MENKKYSLAFDRILIAVDILMVILVIINLCLLGVQLSFETYSVRHALQLYAPLIYDTYYPIYINFVFIDAVFVSIFIVELLIRWAIAIYYRSYHSWFFYPFVHWYDVLGCIPVGSFRILRAFRIVAIIIRLNRMKIIDIKRWYIYKMAMKYLGVITEEISDRVVVNVIETMQMEVKQGIPIADKIIDKVILPRKATLVRFISHRLQKVTADQYELNRDDLKKYIQVSVADAVNNNREMKLLNAIPIVGGLSANAIEHAIHNIAFNVVDKILQDLASKNNRIVIEKIADGIIEAVVAKEEDEQLQLMVADMANQILELVKEEVQVQHWKIKEAKENQALE